jgi:predicted esterase
VFLGTGTRIVSCPETDLLRTGRLLHVAGLRVCTRFYDAGPELSADMLAELNRWVMAEMYSRKPAIA